MPVPVPAGAYQSAFAEWPRCVQNLQSRSHGTDPDTNKTGFEQQVFCNPSIAGVDLLVFWKDIEPSPPVANATRPEATWCQLAAHAGLAADATS